MFIYIHVHGTIIHWHNVRLAFSAYFSFTFTAISVDEHQKTILKEICLMK